MTAHVSAYSPASSFHAGTPALPSAKRSPFCPLPGPPSYARELVVRRAGIGAAAARAALDVQPVRKPLPVLRQPVGGGVAGTGLPAAALKPGGGAAGNCGRLSRRYVAAEREAQAAGLPWFEVAATQSGAAPRNPITTGDTPPSSPSPRAAAAGPSPASTASARSGPRP